MHPMLFPSPHSGLPITSTVGVPRALVIAIHRHFGEAHEINLLYTALLLMYVAPYRRMEWRARFVTTGVTLAEKLKTKWIERCNKLQTRSRR